MIARSSLALGAALIGLGAAAAAQDPEIDGAPIVVSPRPDLIPFYLYDVNAAIELEWRRREDSIQPDGGSKQRDVEDRFREILELRTGGFIGHPNLLELDLGGRFWLEQRHLDFDTTGSRTRSNQALLDWDASGLFLRESGMPFTLYTRQQTNDIDRQFGGTIENRFTETGARVNFRNQVAPTNFQIFRRQIKQRDAALNQDFKVDQDSIWADGRIEISQTQRFAWDGRYEDVDESGDLRLPRSFDRVEANGLHTLEFGDRQQNVARTPIRYYEETGDRNFRQFRIDPRVRLEHSRTLSSWYDYTYETNERPQQRQRVNRGTANVQHQLFDSLTTIGNAGFNLFDIPTENFTSNEIFARIDTQYLKKIPLGRLQAGVDASISRLDQSDLGAPIGVTDEPNTFDAAGMFTIDGRNILESTIAVTDISGLIVYDLGIDYLTTEFPDRVEVTRIPGGNIAPAQTVLVSYVIGPQPGGTTDTTGLGLDLRYTFEEGALSGLSFYGSMFTQNESREIVLADFPENDFTDLRYGIEYLRGGVYLRAERQQRTSTLSPFEALRLEGRYARPLGRGSNLVFNGLFQEIDRRDEGIRTTTATLSGQWNQRVDQHLRLSLLLQYQWSDDNLALNSESFEGQFDLTWRYRQTEIYAQIRTSTNETQSEDTAFNRFTLGLRREF